MEAPIKVRPGYGDGATNPFPHHKDAGYEDLPSLLRDLNMAVTGLQAEGGEIQVTCHDVPSRRPPTIGFDLCVTKGDNERWWEFYIEVPKIKADFDNLSPELRDAIHDSPKRARLARLLQEGLSPEQIEEKLRVNSG